MVSIHWRSWVPPFGDSDVFPPAREKTFHLYLCFHFQVSLVESCLHANRIDKFFTWIE